MDQALEKTILSHVTGAIRRSLSIADLHVALDTHLSEDLALDSLDVVEVAMSLEETFDIEFPQEVVQQFNVVADIVAYLKKRFFFEDERLLGQVA